jgi:hypothetical protein
VLAPTVRARLGLSLQQLGWCFQVMASVGAVVEVSAGLAIDHVRRRPLLVVGAAAWSAAMLLAAGADGFGWLLAACALAGVAYGPLANTADVVLVETHPDEVERVASRSTALDTVGALLAPVSVAVAGAVGVDGRTLLVGAGLGAVSYAALLARTAFPAPGPRGEGARLWDDAVVGVRAVLGDRRARWNIVALLLVEALDPVEVLEPVWLHDTVGASQTLVAVHVAVGSVAGLLALVLLDRWLDRHDAAPVLLGAVVASLVLHPLWVLVPGVGAKLGLVALRDAAAAPLWPLVHARALTTVPGRAGAVTAVAALLGLAPLHAAAAWLAQQIGLTGSLLGLRFAATSGLLVLLLREPVRPPRRVRAPRRRARRSAGGGAVPSLPRRGSARRRRRARRSGRGRW